MHEPPDDSSLEVRPLDSIPSQPAVFGNSSGRDAARRTLVRRMVGVGSLVALLSLLLSIYLLDHADTRATLLRLLTRPTPPPTATPTFSPSGDDAFGWEHATPWGQLLVDGKPGPEVGAKTAHTGLSLDHPFHLTRGRHTLTYRAAPFPTLTCMVSVPAATADTCPLYHENDPDTHLLPNGSLIRAIDLQATVDRLPADQMQALITAARDAVAALQAGFPAGTLAVGDHYLDGGGHVHRANEILTFSPRLELAPRSVQFGDEVCVTLCTATGLYAQYKGVDWALLGQVALTWRYVASDGTVVLADGPTGFPIAQQLLLPNDMTLFPAQWSDRGWRVKTESVPPASPNPLICRVPRDDISEITGQQGESISWTQTYATGDLGCLAVGSKTDPCCGALPGTQTIVLYRAGVFVTMNARARKALPRLVLPSAHERALAAGVSPIPLD